MAKQFAFVSDSGEIQNIMSPSQSNLYNDGDVHAGLTCFGIPDDADHVTYMRTKYRFNGEWLTREEQPSPYKDWSNRDWLFNSVKFWAHVREIRNQKVRSSDWTQVADSPLDEEQKFLWSEYRQALRDVPADNSAIEELESIMWPTEPT